MPKLNKALGIPEEKALPNPTGGGSEEDEDYDPTYYEIKIEPSKTTEEEKKRERDWLQELLRLNPEHTVDVDELAAKEEARRIKRDQESQGRRK